jgi:phage regulator Rha-like protein
MLLVMGFTTKPAMQVKVAFIRAFNEMEEKLKGRNIIALDEYNRNIQRLMNQNDEWERKWKKTIPYIKLGAVAYELAQDTNKVDLTYAFVKGMKSND